MAPVANYQQNTYILWSAYRIELINPSFWREYAHLRFLMSDIIFPVQMTKMATFENKSMVRIPKKHIWNCTKFRSSILTVRFRTRHIFLTYIWSENECFSPFPFPCSSKLSQSQAVLACYFIEKRKMSIEWQYFGMMGQ